MHYIGKYILIIMTGCRTIFCSLETAPLCRKGWEPLD